MVASCTSVQVIVGVVVVCPEYGDYAAAPGASRAFERLPTHRRRFQDCHAQVNPVKLLSVRISCTDGGGHAIADSEITDIRAGENYTKNRWSIGGVITTTPFSLRSEYLAGKDGGVKSDGFYATGCYRMLRNFDLVASYDYFNANKAVSRKQTNYIAGLQYWFYPKCRLQAQYTFCDRNKGKDSNLFQAQVQVRF